MLFERIIPKLAAVFKLHDGMDYEDLLLAFYKKVAEKVELDRLKIYPAESFIDQIHASYAEREQKVPKWFIGLAKTDPRWARLVRAHLFDALLGIFF